MLPSETRVLIHFVAKDSAVSIANRRGAVDPEALAVELPFDAVADAAALAREDVRRAVDGVVGGRGSFK